MLSTLSHPQYLKFIHSFSASIVARWFSTSLPKVHVGLVGLNFTPTSLAKRIYLKRENKRVHWKRNDTMTMKIGRMRISGLIAGVILTVLGALMMAEGIVVMAGNASFMFAENMNRGFEFVVGFVTIVLAAIIMDLSRS
jgi:hypothetical protein